MSLKLQVDRTLLRADTRSRRFLLVELTAPEAPARTDRLPVQIAFVIDRSGSMHGDKLANAKQAVVQGIRSLRKGDRFAVVTYDDEVTHVVASTDAGSAARDAAIRAVERVESGGSTHLHGGWVAGCEQVAGHLTSEAVGRCLLLTDGLANAGLTDHDEIVRQCAGKRDERVVTTTFGLGADFDESLLRRMADAGGGSFQFIESARQIPDFIASEVGEALTTTVREAVVVVSAGEGAVVESLNDFRCWRDGAAWRIAVGSLSSGQLLSSVLRLQLPRGTPGETREIGVRVEDQDRVLAEACATVALSYASEDDVAHQPRHRSLHRQAAALMAARAERDALELNRRGEYQAARRAIEECFAAIREQAPSDPQIAAILDDLERKAEQYAFPMEAMASKTLHSLSSMTLRGRVVQPLRRLQPSAPPSQTLVPTEWDAHEAVGQVLKRVAALHPTLLHSVRVPNLAVKLAHLEERGCLLDLRRGDSGEVEARLEAPDLCPPCRDAFESEGLAAEALHRLVDALRLLGAPSGVVH